MLWRQKNKPGKVSGTWVGPVRLLLQEGPLACHWINFDPCTDYASPNMHKAGDLGLYMMEGTAVLSTPTTIETLM